MSLLSSGEYIRSSSMPRVENIKQKGIGITEGIFKHTLRSSAPEGSPFLRGLNSNRLKRSSLSSGRQIFKKVKIDPRSYNPQGVSSSPTT